MRTILFAVLFTAISLGAQERPILTSLRTELDRSMKELSTQSTPPYFLSYAVTDVRTIQMAASFGGLETDRTDHRRVLDLDIRVGSHQLDNTRSIRGVPIEFGRGAQSMQLPLADDDLAIRTIIWKATDQSYKSAVERLGKVLTNRQVKVREEDTSADLSREQAVRIIQDVTPFTLDTAAWRARVQRLSLLFKGHPHLYEGLITFQADQLVKYIVNSEGTVIQTVEPIVKLFVITKTKAEDGMSLPLYLSYSAYSPDRLPPEDSLREDIQQMISLSERLRTAPLMETYTGPAILSGRSAGVFFHEIFGHRVEGHRIKDVNSSQTFKPFLNKKILPSFIDVVFDPTRKTLGGVDIVGAYTVDDEGVPARPVVAVDSGVFKGFLMSRSPIENFPTSNGHGRRQAGLRVVARQSNLIVQARETVSLDSLRAQLRAECVKQKKEFGLLFDDIQGGFTFTGRTVPNAFNVQPLVVYKIFADGRPDELVRGVDLIGTPLTTFNNIVAAGNDVGIFNGVCGAESGGVPVSASSPSLLVSSIEVQKKQKSQAKLPILEDPSSEAGTTTGASAVFAAMKAEQQRSLERLRLGDLPAPYYVEYSLSVRDHVGAHATLGSLQDSDSSRTARLTVRLRVGSERFDNTNFFDVGLGFFGSSDDEEGFRNRLIAPQLSEDQLRRELWLATDACFKQAVEIFAKKEAAIKNRTRSDTTEDFRLLPASSAVDTTHAGARYTRADAVTVSEAVSSVFRSYPAVHLSRAGVEFVPETTWYSNSEGRTSIKTDVFSGFEMIATAQAPDGMPLAQTYAAYGRTTRDLPSVDSLKRAATTMASRLTTLSTAPTIEAYSGPVLFEGQAAAEIMAQFFAPNLCAQRQPASEGGFSTGDRYGAFQNKIGARVLPEFLSVRALPTKERESGRAIAGHYTVDDEGTPARDVTVVDKGYLKTLLSSRQPTKRMKESNGHQRGGAAMISVIELSSDDKHRLAAKDLRARLMKLVKDRDLPYGIIVRTAMDMNLLFTGIYPLLGSEFPIPQGESTLGLLEVVRVYPDGKEELIRGVEAAGVAPAIFKDILAVGKTTTVHNYLAPAVTSSFVTGGDPYLISTIITPDLLFEDVEIKPIEGDFPKQPIVTSPLR